MRRSSIQLRRGGRSPSITIEVLLRRTNAISSCLPDKIEEAQKELKEPKGSQKGEPCFSTMTEAANETFLPLRIRCSFM